MSFQTGASRHDPGRQPATTLKAVCGTLRERYAEIQRMVIGRAVTRLDVR